MPEPVDLSHIHVSRLEPSSFRTLPLITRALGVYFRLFVDPYHGWLELNGLDIAAAFCANVPGPFTPADKRRVHRAISELQARGFLLRCRVIDALLGHVTTEDDRQVEVSPWLEDEQGAFVVFPDWIAREYRLSRADTYAWHKARQARIRDLLPATTTTEECHAQR